MSIISQMDRSSSHTRMLATPTPCSRGDGRQRHARRFHGRAGVDFEVTLSGEAMQSQNESCALSRLRAGPHFAFMRLHDLIDNGQSKTGPTFEIRLKRLKDLLGLLRRHSGAGVCESNLPIISQHFDADGEAAAVLHGADGILTKIPEHLLQLVPICQNPRLWYRERALNGDACVFSR